ncbi:hypothetical protein [Endozoicomonas sp. 4G]|uniref:hypothetical protein n=1 Tax=Endozoicomonas sp. 4G TaxID=2872754 RepID=UPI0020791E75|nr:hypothetical protein [Endozoicomonas sp. 4G]
MDVTGKNTDPMTGSGLTSEVSSRRGTGSYKSLTVRPAEETEGCFNPANFVSNNTGATGVTSAHPVSSFTLADCEVSHARPKTEKVALSLGHGFKAGQMNLLELLTSEPVDAQCVKEELQKLSQQFDRLHVDVSLMDKVNELKSEISKYIGADTDTFAWRKIGAISDIQSRKIIASHIEKIAPDIAIWSEVETSNLEVLTYIIEQGFPIRSNSLCFDPYPEHLVYLPFDTMRKLLENCNPHCPDLLFVKAIFADADPRFDSLSEMILTSITMDDGVFQEVIAQSIPKVSYRRLKVFFNYLRREFTTSNIIEDLVSHSFNSRRIFNYMHVNRYKNSIIMVFVLEAIAQQSKKEGREEALKLIASFCKDQQQLIAMIAILGGLHQCTELLTEMGISVTRQAFIEASVNLNNSPFLIAKEAGLTKDRLFVNTVNRAAPFLWSLPNKFGEQLHRVFWYPDKQAMSFIHLVMEQLPICKGESYEAESRLTRNHGKALHLGDVSLWVANIFAGMNGTASTDSAGFLQEDTRYSEAWNILINQVKCCNGLTHPNDFMKFMDWLLMEGLSWVRSESEYREQEETFTSRLKSYRPDLWPDPGKEGSRKTLATQGQLASYSKDVTNLHFDIIQSFLRLAPPAHRTYVINNWLNHPDCAKQRETLFCRPVHPLNTMESPNTWQLLLSLDQDYQPQDNQFDNDWKKLDNPQQWTAPPPIASLMGKSIEVNGRTLVIQRADGGWDYLKFLSDTEKPEELAKEGNKISLMAAIASQHGLKSSIPEVVGQYRWEDVQADLMTLMPPAKKAKLEEKCRYPDGKAGYCLHLKSTKDAPYHLYPYVLDPETKADQIFEGLYKYAHDCGVLFSCGLYAPPVMAADHDLATHRKHHILSSYVNAPCEGRMLKWKKASQHPNVGPVGMRDSGDTKSMNELGEDYFFSTRCQKYLDFDKSEDRAKVAFSELAKNAQGLVLQYALCFQKQFDSGDRESTRNHEHKIKVILATLFHKAFPRFTEECAVQAMDEGELLSQAVREIVYWCSHDARFINDIKQKVIPKSTYPDCPETTHTFNLSITVPHELVPGVGFVKWGNEPDLGIFNGVNPLVTLNAVIVKLLAKGVLTSL